MVGRRRRLAAVACWASFRRRCAHQSGTELERGFVKPPGTARPWVYWFWLNGNITREGITADLEAMERAGVGGVLIMEVDQGAPSGPWPSPRPVGGSCSGTSAPKRTGSASR